MRAVILQKIVEAEMGKAVSMTANLDEDIATGATRMSYLLAEKKGLVFDERMRDTCVFASAMYRDVLFADSKQEGIFVTCNEDFLNGVRSNHYEDVRDVEKAKDRE